MRAELPVMTDAAYVASGDKDVHRLAAGAAAEEAAARVTVRPTVIVLNKQELLGDALQRVPAYRALRAAFPEHRLVSLSSNASAFAGVLSPVRHLFLDDAVGHQPLIGSAAQLRTLAQSYGPLDLVLDFRANTRVVGGVMALYPAAPRYIANCPLFAIRKGVSLRPEIRPHSNAERFHRIVEIAAGHRLPFDSVLPSLPAAEKEAATLLPQGERYFGIAAGPMTSKKSWPRQGYIALAAQIRALGLRPVFLLGTDEVEQRGWFEQNVPGAIIIDLQAARGDAMYLFWLLHACAGRLAGCVANESGLGHLVATRGIPLLTLAGPTNAPRWKPLTSAWWLLRAQDFGSNDVAAIPVEAVEEAIGAMVRWNESNRQNALRIDAAQGSS